MSELSEKVLMITKSFMGPASQNFLERQTRSHMKGLEFNDLRNEHLPELLKWLSVSAKLIIDDKAENMVKRMEAVLNVKRAV